MRPGLSLTPKPPYDATFLTRARWYAILPLLVLALAEGPVEYNLSRSPSGPQPTRAPIHLY